MKSIIPAYYPWKKFEKYTYPLGLDLGQIVFLSGTSASEYDPGTDKIVARGDIVAQTKTALEKIKAILSAANLSFSNVVVITRYITPAAFPDLAKVDKLFVEYGLRCVVHNSPVNRLMRRDALLELEVIAVPQGAAGSGSLKQGIQRVISGKNAICFIDGADSETASTTIEEDVSAVSRKLQKAGIAASQIVRARVTVATADHAELSEALRSARRLVPDGPEWSGVGVSAMPNGRKTRISVEICANTPDGKAVEIAGGVVRKVGSLVFGTGIGCSGGADDLVRDCERIYGAILPEILANFGIKTNGLVQTVEWITADVLPKYRETAAIRRKYLSEPFPVASGLVCSCLPNARNVAVDFVATDKDVLE